MSNSFVTLEATYRIVTPMFCSGADQKMAELRLPSIKGALRFWWRSMMWGTSDGRTTDVKILRRKEAELFGTSDQTVGQSKVRMRYSDMQTEEQTATAEWAQHKGIQYLGYGVMNYRGELNRSMIPGGTFSLLLRLGPCLSTQQHQQVQDALVLLGSVGGLGSKSRKGFGSLTLTTLRKNEQCIAIPESPMARIRSVFRPSRHTLPEWTAWSPLSRVVEVTGAGHCAVDVLDRLGREQVHYRSWGRKGASDSEHRVLDKASEKNFPEDHHLSKRHKVAIQHPKRIVFGLPHNYGKGGLKSVAPTNGNFNRRASPLFLHVHQPTTETPPVGVAVFLPSRFLPDGEHIMAFGKSVPLDSSKEFWSPIHGYLDRLLGKQNATRRQTDLNATEEPLDGV